jgi:hypothetical protein
MAAGPAIEMWSKQGGSVESSDGSDLTITRKRGFTVTLSASDPLDIAYFAPGLPAVGDSYPGLIFVYCRNLTASRLAPSLALVTADYSGESNDPESNEVKIRWSGAITDEPIDQDINGKPIVTKNGEPIDGISERIPDMVATISRKFLTINVPAISAYLRSRSSDMFLGWPAGSARLMAWSADKTFAIGQPGFWDVTAEIQFREPYNTTPDKVWWKRVRHEGYMVRDTAGSEPREAWNSVTKSIASRPVLLKADGTQEDDPDNAHWLEFETTLALPYAALGLVD